MYLSHINLIPSKSNIESKAFFEITAFKILSLVTFKLVLSLSASKQMIGYESLQISHNNCVKQLVDKTNQIIELKSEQDKFAKKHWVLGFVFAFADLNGKMQINPYEVWQASGLSYHDCIDAGCSEHDLEIIKNQTIEL